MWACCVPSREITEFAICFQHAGARCLGIVWATAHLALTLCPCKPPVHLAAWTCLSHRALVLPHPLRCLRFVCANLSLVSTSKQKRLSMDSVFRRMQDFSVSWVGPCGGERGSWKVADISDGDDNIRASIWGYKLVKDAVALLQVDRCLSVAM